jgi:hypothetical protein
MTDGFMASDLEQIAALFDDGATDLAGSAMPAAPDAGGSSAAVAGVLSALRGVAGSIIGTTGTASGYVRSAHDSYRDADQNAAQTFGAAR